MDELTLAVAGGGKTQSIIDACTGRDAPHPERTLAITYTRTGQGELATRLRDAFTPVVAPRVIGWFGFLQRYFVRPYLPSLYAGERLRGFNFDGDPGRFAKERRRYLDGEGRAYRRHLAKLSHEVMHAAQRAPIDRLERMFTDIFIDEVQDLVGWDLEILDQLLSSRIRVRAVGDLRQSILETNPADQKNSQYRGVAMLTWFTKREGSGLRIVHQTETHRCNQEIADFADGIFAAEGGFKKTTSSQKGRTGHDGVFGVADADVRAYVDAYRPQCLRYSSTSAKGHQLEFRNFGEVKGLTFDRVLICPTATIGKYLQGKQPLKDRSACGFYVAVTRARHSVALALSPSLAKTVGLRMWTPLEART